MLKTVSSVFFRVVSCSEGDTQHPRGQKGPKCFKTLVFSGILGFSEIAFPLLQAKVRNLKNHRLERMRLFAYSWKLPAYSGAFFYLRLTILAFFAYSFSFFAYS